MLKLAPKEAHIDDLMDRRLCMNAAGYCHDLPGEQGNPLEVFLAYGMGIYANWLLPSDTAKSTVVISKRMIEC